MAPRGEKKRRNLKSSPPTDPDARVDAAAKRARHGPDPISSTQPRPADSLSDPMPASAPSQSVSAQTVTTAIGTLSMNAPVLFMPSGFAGGAPRRPRPGDFGYVESSPVNQSYPHNTNQPQPVPSGRPFQIGGWSPEEDQKLVDLHAQHKNFVKMAQAMNDAFHTNYTPRDCEKRWRNAALKKRIPSFMPMYRVMPTHREQDVGWSPEEDQKLVDLHAQHRNFDKMAQAMNDAFHTNYTPRDCEKRWRNAALKERIPSFIPTYRVMPTHREQDVGWSPEEDQKLIDLKGQYHNENNANMLIAHAMHRAGFTNRTEIDCEERWKKVRKAGRGKDNPKFWSKEEDNKLTQLVKNFVDWDSLNGWEEISVQMEHEGFGREPDLCRTRWQNKLRGQPTTGTWRKEEEDLLVNFYSKGFSSVVVVDLLERHKFFRTVDQCRSRHRELMESLES